MQARNPVFQHIFLPQENDIEHPSAANRSGTPKYSKPISPKMGGKHDEIFNEAVNHTTIDHQHQRESQAPPPSAKKEHRRAEPNANQPTTPARPTISSFLSTPMSVNIASTTLSSSSNKTDATHTGPTYLSVTDDHEETASLLRGTPGPARTLNSGSIRSKLKKMHYLVSQPAPPFPLTHQRAPSWANNSSVLASNLASCAAEGFATPTGAPVGASTIFPSISSPSSARTWPTTPSASSSTPSPSNYGEGSSGNGLGTGRGGKGCQHGGERAAYTRIGGPLCM